MIKLVEVMLLGSSIKKLSAGGSGSRETDYYNNLSNKIGLFIFEYDLNNNKWIHSLFGPFSIKKNLKKNGYNIVRSKQFYGSWSGFILSRLLGSKHIIRCGYIWSKSFVLDRKIESSLIKKFIYFFEGLLIRMADGYIFCSEEIKDHYKNFIDKKPYVIIPNYVDSEKFYPSDQPAINDYVYLGRLIDLKGCIPAANYIKKKKACDKSLFIGQGENAKKLEKMGLITKSRIDNFMLRSELIKYKYFISFSKTEGSPKALFEAIFSGLVPVLSDIPVHREIINSLGYGIIVRKDGSEELYNEGKLNIIGLENFIKSHDKSKHIEQELNYLSKFVE